MENSHHGEFIPLFRRSRQPFSLIIQVIDSRLGRSRFYFDCQKRIINYIIMNYIKQMEYNFLTINIF